MKLLIQLVGSGYGNRSQVLELTRDEMATELLRSTFIYRNDEQQIARIESDYILILMEKPDGSEEEYSFSTAPMMTVRAFIDYCLTNETQLQNFTDWETLEKLNEKLESNHE